jgi:hypothetical protein
VTLTATLNDRSTVHISASPTGASATLDRRVVDSKARALLRAERHNGHQRSLPVHHGQRRRADRRSFDGLLANLLAILLANVGLQRVAEWLHRPDKTRSEMASDQVFWWRG